MADLLRRGLYVVAFNAMEDYLKSRASEHFNNLPLVSSLDFDDLPPGLRKAAVIDAIKNGVREAGYDKSNEIQIIRAVAGAVASTANRQQYGIHEYSVLRSGSNISADDIGAAIGRLHLDRPWDQMQSLLDTVGNVGSPIRGRFSTCLVKRNAAAHDGQPVDYTDLVEIADLATALCFAFDVIFSAGMTRIADNVPTADTDTRVQLAGNIVVRYVAERGNRWCRLNQNKQPFRYFASRTDAVRNALRNLQPQGVVAVLGARGEIIGWHLADLRHPHP
ncbi:hypothetical protein [Mycolicibacterium chubuense]|nr:hypothetical protein [Mycolicibacterium chubuense]